jgi:hypothetical protein
MEEEEYNDIVTYIQDQKYPQNANERVERKVIMCNVIHGGICYFSAKHVALMIKS